MRLVHPEDATNKWRKTLAKVGAKLDEIKLPGNILPSSSSRDETASCRLEHFNREIVEEQERRLMVRDSEMACLVEMSVHLQQFLSQEPTGTYEEWIACLHPENVTLQPKKSTRLFGMGKSANDNVLVLDHRFYIQDSDHRRLWNEYLDGDRSAAIARDSCLQKQQHQDTNILCCGEMIAGFP